MELLTFTPREKEPWYKGKLVAQKPTLKLREIWSIRIHLQLGQVYKQLIEKYGQLIFPPQKWTVKTQVSTAF